jgi:fatty-acyl-CoA synthase
MAVCGGAPAPEPLLRTFADRGIGVLQGYGLTETAPAAIFLVAEYALSKLGAAGQPPLYIETKLIDRPGSPGDRAGVRGEVCMRGPNVTKGYWNRPEATAAAFDAAGWFHTGDIGQYDEDGIISIVDRVKDMVISGGENVYPAEVESVLFGHPASPRSPSSACPTPVGRGGHRGRRHQARPDGHPGRPARVRHHPIGAIQTADPAAPRRRAAAQPHRQGAQVPVA